MIRSVRLRVALAVWVVALAVLSIQMAFVLSRVRSLARANVDVQMRDDLSEIVAFVGTPELRSLIKVAQASRSSLDEMFVEIRDSANRLILSTDNVPLDGIPVAGTPVLKSGVKIWEVAHPGSRRGHRRIRVAEVTVGDVRVRLAESLRREQKRYWALRKQLTIALVAISTLSAVVAFLVAGRALAPATSMAWRAEQLRDGVEGELPVSGSGDEFDRLATVLNQLLGHVRGEVSRMRRMTADVGHALRTPLTSIRGVLELRAGRVPPEEAEELGAALEELDRLIGATNQLLLLEKLEAMSDLLSLEPIDLAELARDLVEQLRIVAEDRGIDLECRAEPAPCRGDAGQLRQAIVNLIDNAIRHTPAGGRVEVAVAPTGERIELAVLDSGPGLTDDELERVFERFYSRAGSGNSIGLGLPIARAIARAHGGDVRASSPSGARFVLELPGPG